MHQNEIKKISFIKLREIVTDKELLKGIAECDITILHHRIDYIDGSGIKKDIFEWQDLLLKDSYEVLYTENSILIYQYKTKDCVFVHVLYVKPEARNNKEAIRLLQYLKDMIGPKILNDTYSEEILHIVKKLDLYWFDKKFKNGKLIEKRIVNKTIIEMNKFISRIN